MHVASALFIQLYLFIYLFIAASLLNELNKNKLKCRKTDFLTLIFTRSATITGNSSILLKGKPKEYLPVFYHDVHRK